MYLNKELLPDVAENLGSNKTKALFTVRFPRMLSIHCRQNHYGFTQDVVQNSEEL